MNYSTHNIILPLTTPSGSGDHLYSILFVIMVAVANSSIDIRHTCIYIAVLQACSKKIKVIKTV